ncbi:MAG TPA: cytochrome c oxidase assembly protein [Chthoniobacterales bacterium]
MRDVIHKSVGEAVSFPSGTQTASPTVRLRSLMLTCQAVALRRLVLVIGLALGSSAFAHELEQVGPQNVHELLRAWSFEPGVVIPLLLSGFLYARGVLRLRRAVPTTNRKSRLRRGYGGQVDIFCFAAGWLALVIALVSPIHPWGSVLFSVHMTQHEILMLITAPLLVLSRPIVAFLWALPKPAAVSLAGWSKTPVWSHAWPTISNPFVAWTIHAIVLWSWHIPALFQATLESESVHALQHASFLFSALLFWWAVIHGRRRALGFGLAVLYMFTTALHSGLLGALITFANRVWYPAYLTRTSAWGLTALEDQQIGGLIMWVPAGLVYIVAGLALFAGWLRESEKRAQQFAPGPPLERIAGGAHRL